MLQSEAEQLLSRGALLSIGEAQALTCKIENANREHLHQRSEISEILQTHVLLAGYYRRQPVSVESVQEGAIHVVGIRQLEPRLRVWDAAVGIFYSLAAASRDSRLIACASQLITKWAAMSAQHEGDDSELLRESLFWLLIDPVEARKQLRYLILRQPSDSLLSLFLGLSRLTHKSERKSKHVDSFDLVKDLELAEAATARLPLGSTSRYARAEIARCHMALGHIIEAQSWIDSTVHDISFASLDNRLRHEVSIVYGLIGAARNNTTLAHEWLHRSLDFSGRSIPSRPDMELATELLRLGLKDPVLAYLRKCQSIWPHMSSSIKKAAQIIETDGPTDIDSIVSACRLLERAARAAALPSRDR